MISILLGFVAGFAAVMLFKPETQYETDTTRFLESIEPEQLQAMTEILNPEQIVMLTDIMTTYHELASDEEVN